MISSCEPSVPVGGGGLGFDKGNGYIPIGNWRDQCKRYLDMKARERIKREHKHDKVLISMGYGTQYGE